jgi:hypothetical protein
MHAALSAAPAIAIATTIATTIAIAIAIAIARARAHSIAIAIARARAHSIAIARAIAICERAVAEGLLNPLLIGEDGREDDGEAVRHRLLLLLASLQWGPIGWHKAPILARGPALRISISIDIGQ